jgi:broad specificity phosphatase PhoE
MLIYLIRHAQSEANAGIAGAPIDCELTPLGRRQAEATGEWLVRANLDVILCSPYVRALETASAIHRATGAPLEAYPPIHEHHIEPFPVAWPLLGRRALLARFPHLQIPDDFADKGWHHPPETDAQALARMGSAWDLIRKRFANDPEHHTRRVCLVSHGSPTGKLIMAFQGVSTIHADIRIENASISMLEATPDTRIVWGTNWVAHLPERTS